MGVYKPCRHKGCARSPRCGHPWWMDFMHEKRRYKISVDEFALARGAERPVATKQETDKVWWPLFVGEVMSGRNPKIPPQRPENGAKTVGDYIDGFIKDYVDLTPLRSRQSKRNACLMLKRLIGHHAVKMLETPAPAEDVRRHYKQHAVSTSNRYLAELRCITNWGIGRDDLQKSPFGRFGVRISAKDEVQRDRRLSEGEEGRLLVACNMLEEDTQGARKLDWGTVRIMRARVAAGESQTEVAASYGISSGMISAIVNGQVWSEGREAPVTTGKSMRDRIVGALETCCRKGELLKIQNKHVDRRNGWIVIPKENAKSKRWRRIPFKGNERLTEILKRRRFLGDEAFVFGDWESGAFVKDFRKAWEHVVLLSAGVKPVVIGRHKGLTEECRTKLADIDLHFHDLRHEGLSRYGEGGMLLRELQELAGHANPQTTTRYEHVGSTRLAEAMQRAKRQRAEREETGESKVAK